MNRAVELIAQKRAKGPGRGSTAKPLKELGEHPEKGGALNVMEGRYGPYVKWEKVNATLPKEMDPESVTLAQAVELVDAKAAKGGKGKAKAKPKAKAAPKAKSATKPKAKASPKASKT